MHRIDRLGLLLSFVGALALALLPLVVFKANRIVPGLGIPHPLGDPNVSPEEERGKRKVLVERALLGALA